MLKTKFNFSATTNFTSLRYQLHSNLASSLLPASLQLHFTDLLPTSLLYQTHHFFGFQPVHHPTLSS
jgi:hypothetical protein